MKRNPLVPFIMIMAVGVLAMFLLSFKGLGDFKNLTEGTGEEGNAADETANLTPEELYTQQGCISCHGEQYQGVSGPELTGVGDRLSIEEIENVLINGVPGTPMPAGLIPAEKTGEMAEWLSELK
ncbi:cytochrome c [Bacillaceae bacterium Marseille-Q3522]|nr:cytochrome c [Bacillaceae bacterium Marseille-Q3522]